MGIISSQAKKHSSSHHKHHKEGSSLGVKKDQHLSPPQHHPSLAPKVEKTPPTLNITIEATTVTENVGDGSAPVFAPSGRRTGASMATKGRTESNLADLVKVTLGDKEDSQTKRQSIFQLSTSERAFLPREVQVRLGKRAGQLPPTPSAYPTSGAVLFVDISGFTNLGEKLRAEFPPKEAASKLASQITHVLSMLTKICIDFRGDVSKFAGDALLCVWDDSEGSALDNARTCSVEMLMEMRRYNLSSGHSHLQIHGGVAAGSLLHFHLGSADDELRTYLVAGEALAAATDVIHQAGPGEIVIVTRKRAASGDKKRSMTSKASFTSQLTSANTAIAPAVDPSASAASITQSFYDNLSSMKLSPAIGGRVSIAFPASPSPKINSSSGFIGMVGNNKTNSFRSIGDFGGSRRYGGLGSDLPAIGENIGGSSRLLKSTSKRDSIGSRRGSNIRRLSANLLTLVSEEEAKRPGRKSMSELPIDFMLSDSMNLSDGNMPPRSPKGLQTVPSLSPIGSIVDEGQEEPEITEKLTADSEPETSLTRGRVNTEADPVLREGLPRVGNVYIPKALRKGLRVGFREAQIRDRVAIMFVGLEELALSDQEIRSNQVRDDKLDTLNSAFVGMTRICHSFQGEIRDLLFDDKGCVYISVFGAHREVEHPDMNAIKAAIAILSEVPSARIGVSVGACFTGMCGTSKRNDFVVMGHEVNMAARYMSCAPAGVIYASPEIQDKTKDVITYEEAFIYFGKIPANQDPGVENGSLTADGQRLKKHTVFKPDASIGKRPSFVAQYIYGQRDKDLFVGRESELELIELAMAKNMAFSADSVGGAKSLKRKTSHMVQGNQKLRPGSVVLIEGPPGMGKSTLVSRAKKLGKGRIKTVIGVSSDVKRLVHPFFALGQVVESFVGLNSTMKEEEVNEILQDYEEKVPAGDATTVRPIDKSAFACILPYLDGNKALNELNLGQEDIKPEMVKKIADVLMQLFRNGRTTNGFGGARGIMVILEDIHFMDSYSLKVVEELIKRLGELRGFILMITIRIEDILKMEDILNGRLGDEEQDAANEEDNELLDKVIDVARRKTTSGLALQLHGLPRADVDQLVARNLGVEEASKIDITILDKIYNATDGYPLFVIHFIIWLTENNYIEREAETGLVLWSITKPLNDTELPTTIRAALVLRLNSLKPLTKNALLVASVLGEEFTGKFLGRILSKWKWSTGYSVNAILVSLREAEEHMFVKHRKNEANADADHVWEWKHDKVRSAVSHSLTPEETTKLQEIILASKKDAADFQKALQSSYKEEVINDDD